MHENDKKESSGIDYGWTWGEYGKDAGVDYFTAPVAEYGLVVAKITKYDSTWNNPQIIVDGISNHISIANTLDRLDVGRYKIEWSSTDPNSTGNFEEIQYPDVRLCFRLRFHNCRCRLQSKRVCSLPLPKARVER